MKFEMDEDERKRFDEWYEKHLKEAHNNEEPYCGAAGGRISYIITPTSIGTFLSAECGICVRRERREKVLNALSDIKPYCVDGKNFECGHVVLTDTGDW